MSDESTGASRRHPSAPTTALSFVASTLLLLLLLLLAGANASPAAERANSNVVIARQEQQQQQQQQQPKSERSKRAATARQDRLWDDAVIPYEIDPVFSDERASLFRAAMRHWENYTCVKFVERVPDEHRNFIVFTERSCGCCSFVGKRGNGAQAISIGKHCDKFGIVVHELGHVVGFWHEHTRPDRDQHVQIVGKNIMNGQEYNFNKLTKDEVNSLGLAYDYDSILHYATNTFAKDTYLDTILPLHGYLNTEKANQPPPAHHQNPMAAATAAVGNAGPAVSPAGATQTELNGSSNFMTPPPSTGGLTLPDANSSPAPLPAGGKQQQTNTTSTPHMINDQSPLLILNQTQIEQNIESMTQFDPHWSLPPPPSPSPSHPFRSTDLSPKSRDGNTPETPKLVLLDGGVVVSIAKVQRNQSSTTPASRQRRNTLDVDDASHMLAMDNMLGKTKPEIGQRVRLSVGDIAQTNLLYRCPKCGRTIQQTSGSFHSPNYYSSQTHDRKTKSTQSDINLDNSPSQSHQNEKDFCEWRLTVGLGERIMINITDLDLSSPELDSTSTYHTQQFSGGSRLGLPKSALSEEELRNSASQYPDTSKETNPLIMPNCIYDYFEIRDGYTHRAPLLAKLCGHLAALRDIIRPIVSSGNRLLVTYRTSASPSSLGRRGFLAQHETLCGGLINLGNQVSSGSTQIKNTLGSAPVTNIHKSLPPSTATNVSSLNPNRVSTNSTSPIDNEVLLSSQTNLRYNNLQSQQPIINPNEDQRENNSRNLNHNSPETTSTTDRPKTFGWNQWPSINTTIIQSPNWPEYYRPSRECVWKIRSKENHQISLKFDLFDLEPHDSCAYDYVEIRNGETLESDLIGRFCGNRVPEQILSSSQSMLVKFVSDSDVNRGGFSASLSAEIDECKLGTHGCSYKCSNTAIPYRCECPSGLELALDGKNCAPMCGGIRNETTGIIFSPGFPDLYPISTKCVWEIIAPSHHRITLNFSHFDLEGIKAQECDYDYVDIRSGTQDGKYIKNGIFCGPNQALVITSIANIMRIEFNSDNSIQKSGFIANYFIDKDECAIKNGGCQHLCTNTIGSYTCSCNNGFILHENKHDCIEGHCTYAIISTEGSFHSPNFPNAYQPNKECAWIFSTMPGHRIKLIFDQFDIESHQECAYDHIALFDGESIDDPTLGRFCGSRRPLTIVSSFNALYLLFRSDATNEKRGFNATHSTVCGGRLQANQNQNDLIYSHSLFDGTSHYNRNEDCEWLIEANYNQRVRIEFTFFSLEADNNCNYDQTIIYDGADDTVTQLARLCGNELSKDQSRITSSGESMLIIFRSDDSINNRGFSLIYTAIENSEDEPVAITDPSGIKYTQSS